MFPARVLVADETLRHDNSGMSHLGARNHPLAICSYWHCKRVAGGHVKCRQDRGQASLLATGPVSASPGVWPPASQLASGLVIEGCGI